MALVARPLAGPGNPGTLLGMLEREGWMISHDEMANTFAISPGHRLIAAFLPERNDFAQPETLWAIRAYGELNDVVWEAAFTGETPVEFVAAFVSDLIKPEPLDTDREEEEDTASAPDVA
jgi:hypothetical protein